VSAGSTEPTITGSGWAYDHAFVRVEPFETVSDGRKRMQVYSFTALDGDAEQWWFGSGLIIKKDGTVGRQTLTTRIVPDTVAAELRRIRTEQESNR
jgi:hypothetical protein